MPVGEKLISLRKKEEETSKEPPPNRAPLELNTTACSQTGCLAPAPELFALRGSGCRNLALPAFVNKPHPFSLLLPGSSFAKLQAHNSRRGDRRGDNGGKHVTAAAKSIIKHNRNEQKTCSTHRLLDTTHSRGGCANRLSLTGPWHKGLYNKSSCGGRHQS